MVLQLLRCRIHVLALLLVLLTRFQISITIARATAVVYHLVAGHHDARLLLQQLLLGTAVFRVLCRLHGYGDAIQLIILESLEMIEQHLVNCASLFLLGRRL